MEKYCVYKHTSPSGKMYIGVTCQRPGRRWRADGSGYRQNEKFTNAIKKYGWDNFKHEVLFDGIEKDEALRIEKELIQKYDTYRNGYNSSLGGDYGGYTDEVKAKISSSVSKLWEDEEYRKHMSEAHKGQSRTGWHHTEEAKRKMSIEVRKRNEDPEYKKKMHEAAVKRCQKRGHEAMSEMSRKNWESPEYRARVSAARKGIATRSKRVLCVETGIIYPSTKDAAKAIGVSRDTIGQVCRGVREMTHGYHWRFADE